MQAEPAPASSRPRRRWFRRRVLRVAAISLVVLLVAAYFGASFLVYSELADVRGSCDVHSANRPDHFGNTSNWPDKDYSAYYMPDYTLVRFPSRQPGLQIAGWYVEADPTAPAVVVVDGLGGCKRALAALLPAGMLWHSGFNVLVIDLRDTGDSDPEDGFSAVGNEEYQDVLGAWDWLTGPQGFPPSRVGILGNSLGAAAVLVAAEFEPQVAAVALNSPFANLPQIMREELRRVGYPTWLAPGAVIMARLVKGEDLVGHNPLEAVTSLQGRSLFVVHSLDDPRVPVHHSYQLQAAAEAAGVDASFWFVDGAAHVRAPVFYPEEFRRRLSAFFHEHLGE